MECKLKRFGYPGEIKKKTPFLAHALLNLFFIISDAKNWERTESSFKILLPK